MAVIEIAKIQVRRGQELQTNIPRLDPGEFGWAQDTERLYIGKRIVEGGNSDENTRILTENDLNNIFSLLGANSTITLTSLYEYRDGILPHTHPRLLQSKLDDAVSLCDFDVVSSFTATNITQQLKWAVEDLFFNSTFSSPDRADSRRILKIPAGHYIVNDVIDLPPMAKIVGEGPELTKITLVSTNTSLFRTVDADGNTYESGLMAHLTKRAKEVHIQGLTLEYSNTVSNFKPLISLDNVLDASVVDCNLRTEFNTTSTTTYGLVSTGIGIGIRGVGGGLGSGDSNLCENVYISGCNFNSLFIGVEGTGTVIRPVIDNSVFYNLDKGIVMRTQDVLPGPSNGHFVENRFESIVREGIYVSTSTYRSNHVSESNLFIQVANGTTTTSYMVGPTTVTQLVTILDDLVTFPAHPVISFQSPGNKSVNDYFERRNFANKTTATTTFYYNPLVVGRTTYDDGATYTATITTSTTAPVAKIALTGEDQMVTMRYQLTSPTLSRKGELLINMVPRSTVLPMIPHITDTFSYIQTADVLQTNISTATSLTAVSTSQFVVSTVTYPIFAGLALSGTSNFYLTGTTLNGNPYFGVDTQLTSYSTQTGGIAVINTTGGIDFTDPNYRWTLVQSDARDDEFNLDASYALSNNYISLLCQNNSALYDSVLEYQINIVS